MAGSRASLRTNSFGRVKGPKSRSLDLLFDGARSRACLASFQGVPFDDLCTCNDKLWES